MSWVRSVSAEEFTVAGDGEPSVVLLPGWATDGRIFGGVLPGMTAVTSGALRPEGFSRRLAAFLDRTSRGPVTVAGWSLGGFLAAEFARAYPDRVRHLVLVGIRRRYPAPEVEKVRESLLRDRQGCLSGFYAQCFYPSQMAEYRRFRSSLQKEYLREMDGAVLLEGLSYLSSALLAADRFPPCPVTILHGGRDAVAPPAEAEEIAGESGRASFRLLAGAGHAAFLAEGFETAVADG